jgi:DNA-binding beta-propeller fold protein YncE
VKRLYLILLIPCAAFGYGSKTDQTARTDETPMLRQVQAIRLPGVEGRIDHMALDSEGSRLFVAALGNNTLEVIDLRAGERIEEIEDLQEPQGVVYVSEDDKILVSNGEGGSLDIYDGRSLELVDKVKLGEDPDKVRYEPSTGRAYVGYGTSDGSVLGVIDVQTATKVADIGLSGHP